MRTREATKIYRVFAMINSLPNQTLFFSAQAATVQRAILRPFVMKIPPIVLLCAVCAAVDIMQMSSVLNANGDNSDCYENAVEMQNFVARI